MFVRWITAAVGTTLLLAACRPPTPPPTVGEPAPRPSITFPVRTATQAATQAPLPTGTASPLPATVTPPPPPTSKPLSTAPGLVALLGEPVEGQQCQGIPAFSPDGRRVALACGTIRIWDVATGDLFRTMDNPYARGCDLAQAAFSPDSRLLVANIAWCWAGPSSAGHLVVWDATSGEQLLDVPHDHAYLVDPGQGPYSLPVDAMAFLPDGSRLVYAIGNGIEIRDLASADPPVALDLGADMFASDLSVSADGRWLYVFMEWEKNNDFPSNYTTVYRAQVWDLRTLKKIRQQDYPVSKPNVKPLELIGPWVVQDDAEAGTTVATDLLTGDTHAWPYRRGWRYASPDGQRVAWFRYLGFAPAEQGVEVWQTDNWRQVDAFKPDLWEEWYWPYLHVTFSPNDNLLGIAIEDQLVLWRLRRDPEP